MNLSLSIEVCDGSEDKLDAIGDVILTAKTVKLSLSLYINIF
jgi:hypothetical protein